jgi:copper chaperone NosL
MRGWGLAGGACGLLLACGAPEPLGPPELHLGQQTCESCAMAVSDERTAAAVVIVAPQGGPTRDLMFDDLGCLLAYERAHPEDRVAGRYVRDYEGAGWLDAAAATYLLSEELSTPMGFGIGAFATPQRAETARAARDGEVVGLDALLARAARGEIRPQGAGR